MKIIKPLSQSLLYKVFEADNKFFLSISILSHFTFKNGPLLSEQELWKFIPDELGKEAIIDQCMPKTNGEVLISGKCHAAGGKATGSEISFSIGTIAKKLYVFGNRYWKKDFLRQDAITSPEYFTEMPITWEQAFGGKIFPDNPLGKGVSAVGELHPLPNVEYPDCLMCSLSDKPRPASFGPIDMMWPVRLKKAGTYDDAWRKELFPGLPRDMNYTFFNIAPQDQWLKGYFTGNEFFEISGMHPSKSTIKANLPLIKSRCFVNRLQDSKELFEEICMNLDTVWLFPHTEKGILIWRGVTEITTDDADDVLHMIAGYERLTDEPKTADHYYAAFLKRIDEENGSLHILNEKDLIPYGEKSALAQLLKNDKPESALSKNLATKAEKAKRDALKKRDEALAKVKKNFTEAGIAPSLIDASASSQMQIPEMPSLDMETFDPDAFIEYRKKIESVAADQNTKVQKALEAAKAKKELAQKKIKDVCEQQGVDFDNFMKNLTEKEFKRPIFSSKAVLDKLTKLKSTIEVKIQQFTEMTGVSKDALIADVEKMPEGKLPIASMASKLSKINPNDPVLLKKLTDAELSSKEMYSKSAHYLPKPQQLAAEEATRKRNLFLLKLENKDSMVEQDFAGADLNGLNLSGCDLQKCYLEDVNLTNANLTGVDLSGAVLARANLTDAVFDNVKLTGTNVGGADCTRTRFTHCDCTEAIFGKTTFTDSILSYCNCANNNFLEAVFKTVSFPGSQLQETMFIEHDLTGADFSGADCTKAIFIKPKMENANFSKAIMENVVFTEASAANANFTEANCKKSMFLSNSNLKNSSFTKADCTAANLMESDCTHSDFSGATLDNANFMKTNCSDSDFSGISAKRTNFMKTNFEHVNLSNANLFEANLKSSNLAGASLKNANLYSAELFRITIGETSFDGANLKRTKLEEWRP